MKTMNALAEAQELARENDALAVAQAQLRMITDTMAVGVTRCSRDARYLWVSPAYAQWLGRLPEEIEGRYISEVIGKAAYETVRPYIDRVLTGQKVEFEVQVDYQGGRGPVWIDVAYTPTFDAAGLPDGWVAVVIDVTERKNAQATIARLASFPERNPNPIVEVDLEGRVQYINDAARRLYPSLEELGARHPFLAGAEVIQIEDGEGGQVPPKVREVKVEGRTFQQTLHFVAGRVRVYSMEITELKRAQQAQSRLAAIVESSDDAIISTGLDNVITTWNAGAERVFGYRADEIIGQSISRIIPPDLRGEKNGLVNRLTRGELIHDFESVRVAKDGRRINVSLTFSPVRDEEGAVVGVSKTCRDITERKRREAALRQTREALARANENLEKQVEERTAKLKETVAELEGLSYSLVHDMRAPLRAMQSFAALLEEGTSGSLASAENLDFLRRIREAARRMDTLITDALNYTRILRDDLPMHSVDLAKLLRGMIESYPSLGPSAADIKIEFHELKVRGNESALTQAFSSLLNNAVKFVAPGVKPRVRIWAEDAERSFVRIWLEDNGIGIPADAHEKIFGMFQRMHRESEYPGTGIGLAIVRKAIQRLGGRVGVQSESGRGSAFWVELAMAVDQ